MATLAQSLPRPGERVLIREGPFASMQADVLGVDAGRDPPLVDLRVLVFGRAVDQRLEPHAVYRLDGLTEGGRLMLPLTRTKQTDGNARHGRVFRIERRGTDYFVKGVSDVAVYPCEGCGREPASETALAVAIASDMESKKEDWRRVTRLYRRNDVPEERCWLRAPGWALAYE